ncbi:MAG: DUF4352 domain-containing protein [Bacilli bacterium]|nr:DUF4352 domain-containing protein [Bacilli bacterium]
MKKILMFIFVICSLFLLSGCNKNDNADITMSEYNMNETALANDIKIKINSVKKIVSECFWNLDNVCQSYTNPKNDFFLIIDLTIENDSKKDINVSATDSFGLTTKDNKVAEKRSDLNSIMVSLNGTIMKKNKLSGQLAFDVKKSDEYYFYYENSLTGKLIKIVIKNADITE